MGLAVFMDSWAFQRYEINLTAQPDFSKYASARSGGFFRCYAAVLISLIGDSRNAVH